MKKFGRLICLLFTMVTGLENPQAIKAGPIDHALPPVQPRVNPLDVYKYAGLPPQKAAEVMTVPEGFSVKLFAGEPDVCQPIAMCLDDRGRLWVAEAYSYPVRRPDSEAKDRILIFEDTDGDGHFDKRTVFMEGLNLVSGLEVGFGGVWIGAAPNLLFVPIQPGADKPGGPPQILLDGWGYQDTHETLNSFTWGPDGWLYGCHGVFTHSRVGKPGSPARARVPFNAGIWRYHPTKHLFEAFAQGTSNPWGLDFDEHGQAFIEACVIPHCFHMIQGARYQRQGGTHFNPYTYEDIQTIADHLHWQGADPWAGNNRSDSMGGGHAHCGLMCYLGGAWPEKYRGQLFMGNIHGRRINMDIPTTNGSGFIASHGHDFLFANDAWARFINLRYGPDGNVYLIDWYDQQACHLPQPEIWDRSNGRIYKVSYRGTKPVTALDLSKRNDHELIELLGNSNEWYVRHARRLLQERTQAGTLAPASKESLARIARTDKSEWVRLRALWALHAVGGVTQEFVLKHCLDDSSPYVRGWAIQLVLENPAGESQSELLTRLAELARTDPSPIVRLYLASAAQRLPTRERGAIVAGLLSHAEDASDHNLPLMYWYAAEPLGGRDSRWALDLLDTTNKIPQLLPLMVRRIASTPTADNLDRLIRFLGHRETDAQRNLVLSAINLGLEGRRHLVAPSSWAGLFGQLLASTDRGVHAQALALGVLFDDSGAFAEMRRVLASADESTEARQQALAVLVGKDPGLAPALQKLLADKVMRGSALRALAAYDDPHTPLAILAVYSSLNAAERRDALATLSSRVPYARALFEGVAAKKIAAGDVSADLVRQLRNLKDEKLDRQIVNVWGVVRATPDDKAAAMKHYRQILTTAYQPKDVAFGRALFARTCQQCHTLFGVGGKVGPDITGANRANLDYLLENILDPSAVIPKEYAASLMELNNGRVITGIVREQTAAAVTIVTATETTTIPRVDISSLTASNTSMMPEDQLNPFSDFEVRSLFAYLQSPRQTEILATADTVKDFFNGKDLTGWSGDPKIWSVEKGEIVGRRPGPGKDEFLKSQMLAGDFRLTLKLKLVPEKEKISIVFHGEALPGGDMRGYWAGAGKAGWGNLWELHGQNEQFVTNVPEAQVKVDDWNDYEILAVGSRMKTWINGRVHSDYDHPPGPRRGIFAFQIGAGGPVDVRFKDVKLEVLPAPKK